MERFVLIALLIAAAGCSSDPDDNSLENAVDNSATVNAMANNGTTNVRPELVEIADCFFEPTKPNPQGAERQYLEATEAALGEARSEYGAFCGSAMPVEIDWESLLASRGFDDGEVEDPGAVTAAVLPFLNGARIYCEGSDTGTIYRNNVQRVLLTATDTADRVGLCFDAASGAVVSRFMLMPDASTATQLDESGVTMWLTDNLE